MTESEYKKLRGCLQKYEKEADRLSVITRKRAEINNGILSMNCAYDKQVNFDYLGEDFKEKLKNVIVSFLDAEIETIRKSMEDI